MRRLHSNDQVLDDMSPKSERYTNIWTAETASWKIAESSIANITADGSALRVYYVMRCISVSFGAVSIVATLFSLYWFIRMRRSFRHE